jgi:hypothetical protein
MNCLVRSISIVASAIILSFPSNALAGTWSGFTQVASPAVGNGPQAVATGDFNRDGKLDIAVTNVTDKTVTILLGNGDGTFTAAASPATGANPSALTVGDFNKDGIPDIAVCNQVGGTLTILLGTGRGTFSATTAPRLASGSSPMGVVTADFNRDGIPDLAVTNAITNATVEIFLGNGDGSFTAGANPSTAGTDAWGIAIGDFNNDSKADLAIMERDSNGNNDLAILLGNGDGTFAAASVISVPGLGGLYVAVADFNQDGHADVAIANYSSSSLTVLLGNGDGTFQTPITPGGANALTLAVGDFNGDGFPDLAVPDANTNSVAIFLSNVSGTC